MRIAQVAPLIESCPPKFYGGTERIVSYLTEELIALGHDVTLFASGDSQSKARLIAPCKQALRLDPARPEPLAYQIIQMNQVAKLTDEFDVIHFHMDYLHFPLFSMEYGKTLTTMHGRLDLPHLPAVFTEFPLMPVVSISENQRLPLPLANWQATVYHGLPVDRFAPGGHNGGYLAFLGRICPEKRVDRAIEIARITGIPLRIAAKVDSIDREYFEVCIRPLLSDPLIEYVGEIGENEKPEFLGQALALLFPIDWPEPFGLVMIEAMATGTPVIAFRKGSVPEVVDEGVTGCIIDTMEEAGRVVERAISLNPRDVRARFEQRFSVERMARDYVAIYEAMLRADDTVLQRKLAA
jgi:glycosyltransferase involved in cell wall biosynthesis